MQFRGGMNELMRQAARMQRKIEQAKTELKDQELTLEGLGEAMAHLSKGGVRKK